jgi:hypothetical protein
LISELLLNRRSLDLKALLKISVFQTAGDFFKKLDKRKIGRWAVVAVDQKSSSMVQNWCWGLVGVSNHFQSSCGFDSRRQPAYKKPDRRSLIESTTLDLITLGQYLSGHFIRGCPTTVGASFIAR